MDNNMLKSNDINLDRKELSEILESFHQEIKGKKPNEIDKSIYLKYLQLLKEKLNSKEYCSDKRFVTYCRRDFLRQEMIDRLEQNVYIGINYLLEAFYDLEDYINNDTWISIGSVCNIPNAKEIIDNDISYKNDGKICKEEKEILVEMIDEFIKKVDPSLYNNIPKEDNSSVLLTLKEWWGEGNYGYEKIDVFYNGNVMLEEKKSTIDETGKKVEKERDEKITTLNEKDLACLSDIIQFINTSCKETETSMIFDYGVEIIINCGYLKECIENETTLYEQLKALLNIFINKNNQELDYLAIKRNFIEEYLSSLLYNDNCEDLKRNEYINKFGNDLCITLIYYCLAVFPDEEQSLETVYNLIDQYTNTVRNTILSFNEEHPVHKYNSVIQYLRNNDYEYIANILKNKMFQCKDNTYLNEIFYLVSCDEDIQFLSKCINELKEYEDFSEYIKNRILNGGEDIISYLKRLECDDNFPLMKNLKEQTEKFL